jgi:hypothetical protein
MSFEYKCVGAPERVKRQRGVRSRSERVALAMQEIISAEAVDGWEYLRTDLVPVEEKAGFFGRMHEVQRAVLIFRRESGAARPAQAGPMHGLPPYFEPPMPLEPEPRDDRDPRLRLSAERGAPPRTNRPPSGLD